ncbi:hypothetical protein WJ02_25095 [Burkholderia vietnamiensis]|nr:hypothetical protein WJ02_25095 [Burkholderia vietnamiensis]CAG9212250.1 hypothetical protein BVI2075_530117 [Burkholderia vietnamiensis]
MEDIVVRYAIKVASILRHCPLDAHMVGLPVNFREHTLECCCSERLCDHEARIDGYLAFEGVCLIHRGAEHNTLPMVKITHR